MTRLYYIVQLQLETIDINEELLETTGYKDITVYEIANDIPKIWFELEAHKSTSSEAEIQEWLDNNGFSEREYELINL